MAQSDSSPLKLAQAQLDAYNQRDIEGFLEPYSDSVEVYTFPNKLLYKGKANMRARYDKMFKNTPDLYCTLKNRIILGNVVIDEESVIFQKNQPPRQAVAIYTVIDNKIRTVHFVQN
jgi:hypothetical protein